MVPFHGFWAAAITSFSVGIYSWKFIVPRSYYTNSPELSSKHIVFVGTFLLTTMSTVFPIMAYFFAEVTLKLLHSF